VSAFDGILIFIHIHVLDNHVKENEMGKACNTHGREEECIQYFDERLRPLEPQVGGQY
jgi:hypothetical protein